MRQYEVIVQLKKEVLDPEGRAIQETFDRLGFKALKGVQVAKRFVLDVNESDLKAGETAEAVVEKLAREFLANPVSQTFQIKSL